MGTRGFIGLVYEGQTTITYNHYDSYPNWLGVEAAKLVRDNDLSGMGEKIRALKQVDESADPTPEQLEDLKERGFWENVSSGKDWYAALRNAQGNILRYIEAGYIPQMDPEVINKSDCFIEWGYLVDLDTEHLHIYKYVGREGDPMRLVASLPFSILRGRTDETIREIMNEIEQGA